MAQIVQAERPHVCDGLSGKGNGYWWYPTIDSSVPGYHASPGDVRQCECGRTWVAGEQPGLMLAIWRREGRFERWRRERRVRRG